MGFKPDAAPAELDHGDVWRQSDLKRDESDELRARSEALSAWASVADTFTLRQNHVRRLLMRINS